VPLLYAAAASLLGHTLGGRVTLAGVDDDDELVARCRAGEAQAFSELYRRHRVSVARLVQRLGVRQSDQDDLIQEAFVQVHRSLADFRGQSRFGTWLYRVTVNVVLMYRRSVRSRPPLAEAPPWSLALSEQVLPDDEMARGRRVAALYRVLEGLSDKKRTVFVLHELEGLSPGEIGKIVGAPVLTVRTRLFYARRELTALMRNEPMLAAIADELSGRADSDRPKNRLPEREPAE
jgi:RNA polymerase sigma-70 factor, ECF subfamily